MTATPVDTRSEISPAPLREQTLDAFRRWGYLQAHLDPLDQYLAPLPLPELDLDNQFVTEARRIYCATIGAEFMHIPSRERREWIAQRLEGLIQPFELRTAFSRRSFSQLLMMEGEPPAAAVRLEHDNVQAIRERAEQRASTMFRPPTLVPLPRR